MRQHMLGIDVSKEHLVCALREANTRKVLWDLTVPNNRNGVQTLLEKTPPESSWVVEPTGKYSLFVVKRATESGKSVLLAPPRKAKAFLASLQSRAKTDKLDGRGLSLFALSQSLAPYPVKEADLDTIDQHLSARKGLSRCLVKLQLQQADLPEAAAYLKAAMEALKLQLKEIDKQIATLSAKTPAMQVAKALQEVPGIGPVTSVAITSRLSAKSFAHPDQFVAYLGLDVHISESGQRKGQRGLTHQGDAELRRLLYLSAQANLRCRASPFKDQYERERAKGLSTTAALCAVARKIARLCWSLHKHGTRYDPARVGVPSSRSSSRPSSRPSSRAQEERETLVSLSG